MSAAVSTAPVVGIDRATIDAFVAQCVVPFHLTRHGTILTTRKLMVRPPTAMIPPYVLRLQQRYEANEITKDAHRFKWYDSRKILQRFMLLAESDAKLTARTQSPSTAVLTSPAAAPAATVSSTVTAVSATAPVKSDSR